MEDASSWEQVLEETPCFVINMDRRPDRLAQSMESVRSAGFKDVRRFRAVDAQQPAELKAAWAAHGNPPLDTSDLDFLQQNIGQQGCLLSQLGVWKQVIDEKLPRAVVFEDDVLFHARWKELAPRYYGQTPKPFDILYMGAQMDYMIHEEVGRVPVYCTHAYMITLEGATKLYNMLTRFPRGMRTIDCMLIDLMREHVHRFPNRKPPFTWYVWNGLKHPEMHMLQDEHWGKRNHGLVYQDFALGTDVKPRPRS